MQKSALIVLGYIIGWTTTITAAPTNSDKYTLENKNNERALNMHNIVEKNSQEGTRARGLEFTYSAGLNIVSSYLFRGENIGGLSVQPCIELGYGGFSIGGWGSIGANDWTFSGWKKNKEADVFVQFSRWGIILGVTHYYYFDNSRFVDFENSEALKGEGSMNRTELHVGVSLDYMFNVPLYMNWYTQLWGRDGYIETSVNEDGCEVFTLKRAYSTYIEIGYDVELPLQFQLTPRLGFSPSWENGMSRYSNYDGKTKFSVNNISIRLNKTFTIRNACNIQLFAIGALNCYGLRKDNIITKASEAFGNQHLNGMIGVGIWF